MGKDIKISEDTLIIRLKKFIDECDADELARLTGEVFGGKCYYNGALSEEYVFTPDENYAGEFNDLKKGE